MKTYEEMAESVFSKINEYNKNNKLERIGRIKWISTAVAIVIGFITSINAFFPAYARTIPMMGSVFAFIQDKLDFMGLYTNYAFREGDEAESNNVSIELSEVYCDGSNLFISYLIKSEDLFNIAAEDGFNKGQIDCDSKVYYASCGRKINLDDVRIGVEVAGLEGEFLDNNTFAGAEIYCLKNAEFPENFMLNISIDSIGLYGKEDYTLKGNWEFSVKVSCNYADIEIYNIEEEKDQHTIEKIVVSPIMITVYSSYPDIYAGTVRYMLVAYSDISPDENITGLGEFASTSGITKIPRSRVGNVLDIYVYDRDSFDNNEITHERENAEKHAIVSAHINLQ